MCCWCEIRKIQIVFSCVCVWTVCWVHQVQSWSRWCSQCPGSCDGGCSRKSFYQKLRVNVIFFVDVSDSFGLFVGQCVASLETSVMSSSRTPLSQSEGIIFGLFLWGVCSQWEWQVSPDARPLSSSVLAFWLFFRFFYELIMFLARCRFFVLVRSTPCVNGQFIQHFLWRAAWQDPLCFFSLCSLLSVVVASATECLRVVVRACSIKCCDGGAACWIVWEWACPPSGTVFHVMQGHIRKHVFLRQWGWCEGWIILQVWSECVAWSVWALCLEVFLVRRYESAIIVYFQVGSARNGGFFLIMFFIRSCCSRPRFMFRSCFWRSLFSSCSFVSVHASVASSSNTFLSEGYGTRSFLVLPSEMFCVFLGGNWQGQVLLGVTVIFLFVSASPPACCDCSVMRRIAFGPCVRQVAFLSRIVSADLDDVVFQWRRIMRNL